MSGRPYFWQSNSGSTKGHPAVSYIGTSASFEPSGFWLFAVLIEVILLGLLVRVGVLSVIVAMFVWYCVYFPLTTDLTSWYAQNMFAFIQQNRLAEFPAAVESGRHAGPVDLVHPRAYVKATVPREMSPRMIMEVFRALPHFPGKIVAHLRRQRG